MEERRENSFIFISLIAPLPHILTNAEAAK
jgi:hypothetical protein